MMHLPATEPDDVVFQKFLQACNEATDEEGAAVGHVPELEVRIQDPRARGESK
jgi:hypothetical protein